MKSKNKIPMTKKSQRNQPTERDAIVASTWAPQPLSLTREEIRKIVIDQIG